MKNITLTRPILFGWRQKVIRTRMAEKWGELEPHQLVAMVRAMNGVISEDDLLVELLDIAPSEIKRLDEFQRYMLGQNLAILEDDTLQDEFIIPVQFGLHPPKKGLRDVSFAEFMHIDTFYMDYRESNSEGDLLKLVSCLYRPYGKDLKRPVFEGVDTSPAVVIDPVVREAIALNYGLVREWLEKAYPEVFPTSTQKTEDGRQKKQNGGWLAVFDGLVGDDIPNKDVYANEPCTEILRYMNRKMVESRKKKSRA